MCARLGQLSWFWADRLAFAIDAGTVAATLALAERHGCSQLKATCVEFIAGGSRENLEAVLETEAFKDLEASSRAPLRWSPSFSRLRMEERTDRSIW